MNSKYSVIFTAVASALLLSQTASAQSLSEAVDKTVKTNPEVLIGVNQRLAIDEEVKQAQGGYYPKVDLSLGYGREWSRNSNTELRSNHEDTLWRGESGLTLSQMLYDGFGVRSEVERQKARVDSAAYKLAGTADQIGLGAVEKYLDVVRRQELLELTQNNLSVHERIFEQIKLRSDSGVGRKADLEQAQSRLALAQANLASAEANLRESKIQFNRVVGEMPDVLARPADPEGVPGSAEDAISTAVSNHPFLRSSQADIEAARAQTRAAESLMRPRVDLELGTNWGNNLDGIRHQDDDGYAMLRFRYNLYRGGSDQARVAQRRVQEMEATEVSNRTRREVEESTRLSWNALQTARDRLPSQKLHADAAELTREAYYKQFNIGQRTLLDLLDSENELYTARTQYVDGQFLEMFARYRLLADMGNLIGALGVAAPEATKVAAQAGSGAPAAKPEEAAAEPAPMAEPAAQGEQPETK